MYISAMDLGSYVLYTRIHTHTQVCAHVCVLKTQSQIELEFVRVCVCFVILTFFSRSVSTCIELLQNRCRTFRFSLLSACHPSLSCNATSLNKTKSIHIGVACVRMCVWKCTFVCYVCMYDVRVLCQSTHIFMYRFHMFFFLLSVDTTHQRNEEEEKMMKKHSVIGRCYSLTCCC